MRRVMAVYDLEEAYAKRFADVVNQREQVPFEVMAFTSLESLKNYVKQSPVEILLISREVRREEIESLGISQVIVLSDRETVPSGQGWPCIYKYQSSGDIVREVMAYYCERPAEEEIAVTVAKRTILGVYSPVNRCLKTSFALTLGQLLARECKVLLVNLESGSGFGSLLKEEYRGDISDLMYFYKQGDCHMLRLASLVHSIGEMDYIPPAKFPEDTAQLTGEQMAQLLKKISGEGGYEIVIVDVGQYGRQVLPLLEICTWIYMPVKEDSVSLAKVEEFEAYLEVSGHGRLREIISRLKLPYHNNFGRKDTYIEELLWGELGDYVRQMIRGQKQLWNR